MDNSLGVRCLFVSVSYYYVYALRQASVQAYLPKDDEVWACVRVFRLFRYVEGEDGISGGRGKVQERRKYRGREHACARAREDN
jgi:hypothetical protein